MKILNYGAGAVGLGVSSCLLKNGKKVDIITREETVCALKNQGLIRTGIFGNFYATPDTFSCYASLNELPSKIYDFILVSTKSFDSHFAAKDLANHSFLFNKKTKIILCQNGWGNAQTFASFFPKEQIYNARVITGFSRDKPNEVKITVHADAVRMGSLFSADLKAIEELCRSIAEGDLPCEITQDIGKDLWAKMFYNCALNSLGAILDVPYGVLGERKSSRILMKEIIYEAFSVMKAAGYETHWPTAEAYLDTFYTKLLPPTASHQSSTLQDIKAKKKTEIDALNGAVVRLADQFKIAAPFNRCVYQAVKFIEEKNLLKK